MENNLFVKPEKCKWKVQEVEFLGVVIGPRGVEMQKEKVKGVLNWLVPRNIVMPQANFLQKITFDTLYINRFLIRVHSRTLSIILRT